MLSVDKLADCGLDSDGMAFLCTSLRCEVVEQRLPLTWPAEDLLQATKQYSRQECVKQQHTWLRSRDRMENACDRGCPKIYRATVLDTYIPNLGSQSHGIMAVFPFSVTAPTRGMPLNSMPRPSWRPLYRNRSRSWRAAVEFLLFAFIIVARIARRSAPV